MTRKKSYWSCAASVLDCGGCDAALFPVSQSRLDSGPNSVPSLPKAIEGYSSLLKAKNEKIFFPHLLKTENLNLKTHAVFGTLLNPTVTYRTPPGGTLSSHET
jgi:hypothetical protein